MRLVMSTVALICSPKCLHGSTIALRISKPRRRSTFSSATMSIAAHNRDRYSTC